MAPLHPVEVPQHAIGHAISVYTSELQASLPQPQIVHKPILSHFNPFTGLPAESKQPAGMPISQDNNPVAEQACQHQTSAPEQQPSCNAFSQQKLKASKQVPQNCDPDCPETFGSPGNVVPITQQGHHDAAYVDLPQSGPSLNGNRSLTLRAGTSSTSI
jgi:hypothetical protein